MLSKRNKFSKKDFQNLNQFVSHKKTFPYGMVFCISPQVQKSAIVLSKKYVKNGVERNLIKRIFFRAVAKTGQHCVVFIKTKVDPLQFAQELDKMLTS